MDIECIVKEHCGCEPHLLQHVIHWVYEAGDYVVKVAEGDLDSSVGVATWLESHEFDALGPKESFCQDGHTFYIYEKGENNLSPSQTASWMGKELNRIHDIKLPKELLPLPYRDFVEKEIEILKEGQKYLPKFVVDRIREAQQLKDLRLVHGDPHAGNIVRVQGNLKFIDWDYHMFAPKEHDLAIVKFGQLFGAKTTLFDNVTKTYGSYCPKRMETMLLARLAVSTLWLGDEVAKGIREDTGEIERRLARLEGDTSVILYSEKIKIIE